jgi:hypothetical protein
MENEEKKKKELLKYKEEEPIMILVTESDEVGNVKSPLYKKDDNGRLTKLPFPLEYNYLTW